jgi:hypothetical protein
MELSQTFRTCKQDMSNFVERVSPALFMRVRFNRHTKQILTFTLVSSNADTALETVLVSARFYRSLVFKKVIPFQMIYINSS